MQMIDAPNPEPFERLSDEQKRLAALLLMACGHIALVGDVSVVRVGGRTSITFVVDDDVLPANPAGSGATSSA